MAGRVLLIGGCIVWGSISAIGFLRWWQAAQDDAPYSGRREAEWRKVALACAALAILNLAFGVIYHWRTWW
jgi:formate hydrogenlyase subunit 3/multisubunit Na+/H+ antiporter MnhD subunit